MGSALRKSSRAGLLACALLLSVALIGCRADPEAGEPRILRLGDDLLASAGRLAVRDSVAGDALLAGGSIAFTGIAGGDYLGAGGEQAIGGRVGGSVRAAAGQIRLTGTIGRNAALAAGRVEIAAGAVIEGNAYVAGGQVRVAAAVNGSLQAAGGEVVIDGPVGGEVRVQGGRLTIGPRARIEGDLSYRVAPENVLIDPSARIRGATVAIAPRPTRVTFLVLRVLWTLGFLVAGAAAVAVLPGLAAAASEAVRRRPGRAAGLGLGWAILTPLAAIMLGLTLVGVPLALILAVLYVISLYLGRAVVALWLGRLILGLRIPRDRGGMVAGFLVGGVLLLLVSPVPWVGGLAMLLASLIGAGALIAALRDRPPPEARADSTG